ncbi:Lipopolysaccharide core biosynthesis protein RfaG [invertebrate metagenome]|uniref:Lipopolysaccharide core biosynthesis protein RfaG n=1 Tax=invertebrate metagenome TaxID=1711999 RepID=A0A2H9T652_9ZZZZ
MTLAFALFRYFPFGGLQRDFLRIAMACQQLGYNIRIYSAQWQGEKPYGLDIRSISISGTSNHRRMMNFHKSLMEHLSKEPVDLLIGFNKMPGLDVYYAADTCYLDKALKQRSWFYRLSPRFLCYRNLEAGVFSKTSETCILTISALQKPVFQQHYGTQNDRFFLLPPGIARDRCRPDNADTIRADFRKEFHITSQQKLVLMVGSGFKTKGLDRAIIALSHLPDDLREQTRLFVVGQDKTDAFIRLAKKMNVEQQVLFFSGRKDVPRFLLGADLLIHPAYNENTGTVLLEALVAGLPVLTTDVCGYAHYITDAGAGMVMASPFLQDQLNQTMACMLTSPDQQLWQENAIEFSKQADLYSLPERAAAIIGSLAKIAASDDQNYMGQK